MNGSKLLVQLRSEIWPRQLEKFESLLNDPEIEAAGKPDSSELIQAVRHQILAGGKRIRAVLPVLAFRFIRQSTSDGDIPDSSFDEKAKEAAEWLGLALELLHSATLCHDDVMDGDRTRRNVPTVWAEYGVPQAINAGDFLFYLAQEAIHRAGLPAEGEAQALRSLARLMRKLIHGQAFEIELRRKSLLPDLKSYETIAVGKTGGLFSLGLVWGGIAASANPSELESLDEMGSFLGRGFQIQDDIIDLLGEKGRGLPGSDLWEGKPSWLIAYAATQLSAEQQKELARVLYIPRPEKVEKDICQIYSLLEMSGAISAGKKSVFFDQKGHLSEAKNFAFPSLLEELVGLISAG